MTYYNWMDNTDNCVIDYDILYFVFNGEVQDETHDLSTAIAWALECLNEDSTLIGDRITIKDYDGCVVWDAIKAA